MPSEALLTEYERAHEGAVMIERSDVRYVRVYGRDPVRMVQGLVSNDIGTAAAGRAVYAAVLTPKGKMVADVRVFRRGDELLVETHRDALDNLIAHLRKFVPPLFARFEPTDSWACVSVYGPAAAQAVAKVIGFAPPPEADSIAEANGLIAVGSTYAGVDGFDVVVATQSREMLLRDLEMSGVTRASLDTLEVLRVEAGTPRWGAELDETVIPLEAGLRARAISESKGCYTGQEIIIRILHRGHVNWLLRGIRLGDSEATPGCILVDANGKRIGRVTSVVWSPRAAQNIALAYVRREIEPETEVRVEVADGAVARVVSLDERETSRITH
jgi:tRNA-modifying protein YgfZ